MLRKFNLLCKLYFDFVKVKVVFVIRYANKNK